MNESNDFTLMDDPFWPLKIAGEWKTKKDKGKHTSECNSHAILIQNVVYWSCCTEMSISHISSKQNRNQGIF